MLAFPIKYIGYNDAVNIQRLVDILNANFRSIELLFKSIKLNVLPENTFDVRYPNLCYNSSFELFDSETMRPYFWETTGQVSGETAFDGMYSLKLAPGDMARQKDENGVGLILPLWYERCNKLRVTFRAKGTGGAIRISVVQSALLPLEMTRIVNGKKLVITGNCIEVETPSDWDESLFSVSAKLKDTSAVYVMFNNVGTRDVYLDAVVIEPDWTGNPSYYRHGPVSLLDLGNDEWLEYGYIRIPVNNEATLTLNGFYTETPIVTFGIVATNESYLSGVQANVTFACVPLWKTYNDVRYYDMVKIVNLSGGMLSDLYVCVMLLCRGRVKLEGV